jgi:topoisomerase-4 subunit A
MNLTVLKGRTKEEEVSEISLAEFIDVKGLKANGNRLSQFEIKSVELIEQEEAVENDDTVAEEDDSSEEIAANHKAESDTSDEVQLSGAKAVEFEITNPEDVDLEDDGQIAMF